MQTSVRSYVRIQYGRYRMPETLPARRNAPVRMRCSRCRNPNLSLDSPLVLLSQIISQ